LKNKKVLSTISLDIDFCRWSRDHDHIVLIIEDTDMRWKIINLYNTMFDIVTNAKHIDHKFKRIQSMFIGNNYMDDERPKFVKRNINDKVNLSVHVSKNKELTNVIKITK
jgi:hypothetical protein